MILILTMIVLLRWSMPDDTTSFKSTENIATCSRITNPLGWDFIMFVLLIQRVIVEGVYLVFHEDRQTQVTMLCLSSVTDLVICIKWMAYIPSILLLLVTLHRWYIYLKRGNVYSSLGLTFIICSVVEILWLLILLSLHSENISFSDDEPSFNYVLFNLSLLAIRSILQFVDRQKQGIHKYIMNVMGVTEVVCIIYLRWS